MWLSLYQLDKRIETHDHKIRHQIVICQFVTFGEAITKSEISQKFYAEEMSP